MDTIDLSVGPAEEATRVDVIIVGAGISGLVSANKLLEKEPGLHLKIFEASSDMGGHVLETPLGATGAKWVSTNQYHMHWLLEKLNVSTRRRFSATQPLPRCWDLDRGFFASFAKYELNRYLKELDIKTTFFRPSHLTRRKNSVTMHRHICNRLFFSDSRKFMFNLVQVMCGVDARDITFTEFMSLCYTCGGLRVYTEIYVERPNTLLEFSSKQLLKGLSDRLQYAQFLFTRKVVEIQHYRDYVEVYDSQQEVHTADAVILAIPLNHMQKIFITPSPPKEQQPKISAQTPKSKMVTSFIASYQEGHWRKAGYSGDFLNSEPFIIGYEYRATVYAGFMVHEQNEQLSVQSTVCEKLAEYFGVEMRVPTAFQQHTFELSTLNHIPYTTPWHRIIWSSSAAASTCFRGLLGGAVQSGLRAGINALLAVRPQTVGWQDVADLRCPAYPSDKQFGAIALWLSSLNLYNVTYYSVFIYAVFSVLQYMYKKPSAN